jgi:tetratricopeptide (TPR) repeat protein
MVIASLDRLDAEFRVETMPNLVLAVAYVLITLLASGCTNDNLVKANQQRLDSQQAQLQQLRQELSALQAQHSYTSAAAQPGSCDDGIMREATRKGGERFAVGDFSSALNYYQDAVSACPDNAQANLNLARAYEALGDKPNALAHYRTAASGKGSQADDDAVRQARAALSRLGG